MPAKKLELCLEADADGVLAAWTAVRREMRRDTHKVNWQ